MSETIWTPQRRTLAAAEEAAWRGVPHVDRIAVEGVGIDCVQFVVKVLSKAGVVPWVDITGYSVKAGMFQPDDQLVRTIETCLHCERIDPMTAEFGAVAVFKTGHASAHCGVLDDWSIWHTLAGKCVTRSDWSLWRHKCEALFRVTAVGFKADPNQELRR